MTLNILVSFISKYFREVTKISAENSATLSTRYLDIFFTSSQEHGERKRKAFTSASLLGSEKAGGKKERTQGKGLN